jgi:hypothetical protein
MRMNFGWVSLRVARDFRSWGIREGQPDLGYFVPGKIIGQFVDVGSEEGGVGDVVFQALLSPDVEAIAFEVDAEKIAVGVHLGEADGIFTLSAGELKGEGMVV